MPRASPLALAVLFLAGRASGDFWVDPSGSDSNPGTASAPFASPRAALLAARALPRPITADTFVNVRAGVYVLNETLTLLPGDGGDGAGARIVWRGPAAGGGAAVLSGGAALAFAPVPGRPGIVRAALPAGLPLNRSRQLFVGGARVPLARVPAAPAAGGWPAGLGDAGAMHYVSSLSGCGFAPASCYPPRCPAGDADGFVFDAADPAGAPEPSWLTQGGAVLIQTFGSWTSGYAPLRDIVAANSTLLTAAPLPSSPGQFGGRGCPSGARWIAHNVEAALAPGSGTFYVDDAARAVYYAPAAGDDPADAVMPVLDTLLAIAGDDCGGPVAWTAFEGLNFSYAADGGGRLATGVAPTGAITVAAALHFNLSGVSVQHVGGSGILLLSTSRAITIDGCAVRDAGGDGLGAIPGQTDTNVDTVITNTVVEAIGRIYLVQPAGMRIMGSGDQGVTTVAHNHVRDTPYSGIAVGWHAGDPRPAAPAPWRYNISANLVEDVGTGVLNDFGGIYVSMGAPGYKCEDTDSCYIPTLVDANLVRRVTAYNFAGNGAYTDENVAGVTFSNNAFAGLSHNAIYFHCGLNLTAQNNILFGGDAQQEGQTSLLGMCNTGGVAPAEANISATVTRNVFVVVGAASTLFEAGELAPTANVSFDANVYWAASPRNASSLAFPPGNSRTFAQWQAAGEDGSSAVADPLIANAGAGDGADWTLLPASPALSRGFQQLDFSNVGPRKAR